MHPPRFFLGLMAVATSMIQTAQAGPVQKVKATLPGFYQPTATRIEVPQTEASFVSLSLTQDEAFAAATDFLSTGTGVENTSIEISQSLFSPEANLYHIHYTEMFHGLPIANSVSNVNIDTTGSVLSIHQSFVPTEIKRSAVPVQKRDAPVIPLEQAILNFAEAKGFKTTDKLTVTSKGANKFVVEGASFALSPIHASEKYYQTATGLIHVWDISVEQDDVWENAFINSETGEIVGVANWTSDFSAKEESPKASTLAARAGAILDAVYSVIPIGQRNPKSNNGLTQVKSPWDTVASPSGWHYASKDLSGNNVYAQSNPNNVLDINKLINLPRPSSANLEFNYRFDATKGSEDAGNRDVATTNMFYVTNAIHDVFYNYGFDEVSGNFQDDNFGRGGQEYDPVVATAQDGAGKNNANFATPPDGYPGKMRMYVFTSATPDRDGALENDIIIHELGHGLSNRLTGGPTNANCLQTVVSGGLGEGWSDVVGFIMSVPATFTRNSDYAMGYWAVNRPNGVRKFPYSTSLITNKRMFSDLKTLVEVHAVGEVWAEALYEVMWNLIDAAGFTAPADIGKSANSGTGNTVLLKVLIAAMKIQPCNPDFIQARNAIIRAEKALYNGKFSCEIWKGFAKRGVGLNADNTYNDNFDVPTECQGQSAPSTTSTTPTTSTTSTTSTTTTTTTTKATTTTTTTTTTTPTTTTTTTTTTTLPTTTTTNTTSTTITTSTTVPTTTTTTTTTVPTTTSSTTTTTTPTTTTSSTTTTTVPTTTSTETTATTTTTPSTTTSEQAPTTTTAPPTTTTASPTTTSTTTEPIQTCAEPWKPTTIYKDGSIVSDKGVNFKRQTSAGTPGGNGENEIAWVSLGPCVPATTTAVAVSSTIEAIATTADQVTTASPVVPTTTTEEKTVPTIAPTTTTTSANCYPEWSATLNYPKGSLVTYKGINYKSKWWKNPGFGPATSGDGGWVSVGACDGNGGGVVLTEVPTTTTTSTTTTTTAAETTDAPIEGNPLGKQCSKFGASQCVGGATYNCGGSAPFTWQLWYNYC
ncbi:Fungalysin metallopeptidase-domain-containing protein [Obelidium mucronatum]|nr:Fungalysin metallopeptidase-domain-containing protein [Obelidium mucronatum]